MHTHINQNLGRDASHNSSRIRRVTELERGEAAFVPTHAAWVQNGRMYLNGEYPIHSVGGGSFGIRLVKDSHGLLKVDLSAVPSERFAGFSSFACFAGSVTPVAIDEALEAPLPDPEGDRIVDLKSYDVAFIDPAQVWVFEGKRMWLNGYTRVRFSADRTHCLKIVKGGDGAISVDLLYCEGFRWAREMDDTVPQFPLQVLKRIDA